MEADHANAHRAHGRLDVLHGVINRHASGHRATGAIDVQGNFLLRIFHFQEQQLRHHQIGQVIINLATQENDSILEQAGIDVKRTLPPVGLLNDHRNQRHASCLLWNVRMGGRYFVAQTGALWKKQGCAASLSYAPGTDFMLAGEGKNLLRTLACFMVSRLRLSYSASAAFSSAASSFFSSTVQSCFIRSTTFWIAAVSRR